MGVPEIEMVKNRLSIPTHVSAVGSVSGRVWYCIGVHLWRGQYDAFIRCAQTKFCRYLIVVPLSTFHRLAELIGDPNGELIFLFNTGRCGSTLLTQVLSLGNFLAVLHVACNLARIMLKRYHNSSGERTVLKHTALIGRQLSRDNVSLPTVYDTIQFGISVFSYLLQWARNWELRKIIDEKT